MTTEENWATPNNYTAVVKKILDGQAASPAACQAMRTTFGISAPNTTSLHTTAPRECAGEEAAIKDWQIKRDGTLRGIVEILGE